MKYIPLTQGMFAIVDDEDYDYLMQWKWHARKRKHTFYAARVARIADDAETRTQIWMHRVILNTPLGMETDHRNHNGLDNRKENIRVCTRGENQHNQSPQLSRASKYKGIYRHHTKWRAQICHRGKALPIGRFETEIEAAKAYDARAKEVFGEFAYLNFKETSIMDAEFMAKMFHDKYEKLAPSFGYKTRDATAKSWFDIPENNKKLMIAVAQEILIVQKKQTEEDCVEDCSVVDSCKDLVETVCLLNSMIKDGEKHSKTSRKMVKDVLANACDE